MRKICCWLLLGIGGLLAGRAQAQRLELLPDMVLSRVAIREVGHDRLGFAWVAARQGLFRYDGRQLLPLARLVRSGPALSGGAYRVVVDSAGTVWAGMQDGLYAFEPATGQLRKVPLPALRSANGHINALLLHRGALWIGRGLDPLQVLRPAAKTVTAELLNSLGQRVLALSLPTAETTVDLCRLAAGVYTLRLTLDGQPVAKRIVID